MARHGACLYNIRSMTNSCWLDSNRYKWLWHHENSVAALTCVRGESLTETFLFWSNCQAVYSPQLLWCTHLSLLIWHTPTGTLCPLKWNILNLVVFFQKYRCQRQKETTQVRWMLLNATYGTPCPSESSYPLRSDVRDTSLVVLHFSPLPLNHTFHTWLHICCAPL